MVWLIIAAQASPLVVAIYTPMELIATTICAIIFLGEQPGVRQVMGALCILAGLMSTDVACPLSFLFSFPSSCSDHLLTTN